MKEDAMSDVNKEQPGPRSDFSSSLDKEVEVLLRSSDYAGQVSLASRFRARLVGVERFGIWVEPAESRKQALEAKGSVEHYFLPWSEVLTVIRFQESELFQTKKEYRGLRPS
jgi:hypothetical protein